MCTHLKRNTDRFIHFYIFDKQNSKSNLSLTFVAIDYSHLLYFSVQDFVDRLIESIFFMNHFVR